MTSAEVDSPPVLDSEVSGTIASLRERFEAVRRAEIHRVRGRLGNLSSDKEGVVGLVGQLMRPVLTEGEKRDKNWARGAAGPTCSPAEHAMSSQHSQLSIAPGIGRREEPEPSDSGYEPTIGSGLILWFAPVTGL
jgi:hypothetical protein